MPKNAGKSDYKRDFVGTGDYQLTIEEIRKTLSKLMKNVEKCSDNFNSIDLDEVLNELENCDFNDSYYLKLAQANRWKIVTDDADFFKNNKSNVEIITANTANVSCC